MHETCVKHVSFIWVRVCLYVLFLIFPPSASSGLSVFATHSKYYAARHYNTPKHAVLHCLSHTQRTTLQHSTTRYNTLHYTVTNCSTLLHAYRPFGRVSHTHKEPQQHSDMPHSYTWRHASFMCVACLIHMCGMPHPYVWHAAFVCMARRVHVCDMPHSYVWHAAFICVTCLIYMCAMPHSYAWHAAFICVTCHICMCAVPHPCAWPVPDS